MALYPDVQAKVQAEIDSVFGKEAREFSLSDRDKLPYTEATLSEIQRIAGIVSLGIPHQAMTDIELGGYKIPKGAEVCQSKFTNIQNVTTILVFR